MYLFSKSKKNQEPVDEFEPELQPIVNYSGNNSFVNDIKTKLLKFKTISPKQFEAAMKVINKEGINVNIEPTEEITTYVQLTKAIQDEFVRVLNSEIESQELTSESITKRDLIKMMINEHFKK